MEGAYAMGIDQRTGARVYYKYRADYEKGRATKQASANRRRGRALYGRR